MKKTKRCSKCKQIKPISEFHKDRSRKNGYSYYCKTCQKHYRQSKKGKIAKKRYDQSPKGKIAQKRYQQSKKGKAIGRARTKRFIVRHPNRLKAHNAVSHAIRGSKLSRPDIFVCHYCPNLAEEYHHWSYLPENWLNVIPICKKCHRKTA